MSESHPRTQVGYHVERPIERCPRCGILWTRRVWWRAGTPLPRERLRLQGILCSDCVWEVIEAQIERGERPPIVVRRRPEVASQ